MLGGTGNDLLEGSDGRDLIIGGTGVDTFNAGQGDDILVPGATTHDANDAALTAILAEWTSVRNYATRVKNLRDGTGSATRLNGPFFLKKSTTVPDDAAAIDTLMGSSDLDWFFKFGGDSVNDLQPGEVVD